MVSSFKIAEVDYDSTDKKAVKIFERASGVETC